MSLPVWNLQHPDFYRVILANYPDVFPNGRDRMANSIAAENTAIAGIADQFTASIKQAVDTTHKGHKAAYRQTLQQAIQFYEKTLGGLPVARDFKQFLEKMPEGFEGRLPPNAPQGVFNLLLASLLIRNQVVDERWLGSLLDKALTRLRDNPLLPFQVPNTPELVQQIQRGVYRIAGEPVIEIIPNDAFIEKTRQL